MNDKTELIRKKAIKSLELLIEHFKKDDIPHGPIIACGPYTCATILDDDDVMKLELYLTVEKKEEE